MAFGSISVCRAPLCDVRDGDGEGAADDGAGAEAGNGPPEDDGQRPAGA